MPATCYVFCPAFALHGPLDRRNAVDAAKRALAEIGVEPVLSPLLDRHLGHGAWLPARERERDLDRALRHDLIWACRGGHGSVHLVARLLAATPRRRPLLLGYSDLTSLHACWRVRGWDETFYGALPTALHGSRSGDSLLALLHGEGYTRSADSDAMALVLRPGRAQGTCFTACLTILAGLCGTPAMPDLRGCILAIEDVDERPFRIDAMLHQLHQAGSLAGVVGLVGGTFPHLEKPDYAGPGSDEVLAEWAARLRIPAISRLPFGHLNDGLFMPCGRPATLRASADGEWQLRIAARATPMPWLARR